MKWDDVGSMPCSVARTLAVLGDRWTMLILRNAFLGHRRFEAFQTQLGLTRHVLAERLARLVDEGIFTKRAYQDRPPRFEYRLSQKGLDLYPVLLALAAWGDRWKDDGNGPPVVLRHRRCAHVMHPVMVCSNAASRSIPGKSNPCRGRAGPSSRRTRSTDGAGRARARGGGGALAPAEPAQARTSARANDARSPTPYADTLRATPPKAHSPEREGEPERRTALATASSPRFSRCPRRRSRAFGASPWPNPTCVRGNGSCSPTPAVSGWPRHLRRPTRAVSDTSAARRTRHTNGKAGARQQRALPPA